MIETILKDGEIIFYHNNIKDKKYSTKDRGALATGIAFLLIALVGILAIFWIHYYFFYFFLIAIIISFAFLIYFFKVNNDFFSKNGLIHIEYIITNKRFIVYNYFDRSTFELPLLSINKILVKNQNDSKKGDLVLILDKQYHIKDNHLDIANNDILIEKDRITIYKILDPCRVKNQIEFANFVSINDIKNIEDFSNYLHEDEKLLYQYSLIDYKFEMIDYRYTIIFILIPIFITLFHNNEFMSNIIQFIVIFYIFFFIYYIHNLCSYLFYRNTKYNLKYGITNQRILFLDLNNYILYAGELKTLKYINVNHYNRKENLGNICLHTHDQAPSKLLQSKYNRNHVYETLFPNHYGNHIFTYPYNPLKCPKIKLYFVKDPRSVIDTYILKDE